MPRRIVTGLDPDGKSAVHISDDIGRSRGELAWMTTSVPADNDTMPRLDNVVVGFDLMHSAASTFLLVRTPPGSSFAMHATNTIDYVTMISGHITFGVETGEVTLSAGDLLIDRGVLHSWRNDGAEDAVYSVVTMPATAVGPGPTL